MKRRDSLSPTAPRGFTLVEMVVAITLCAIVMVFLTMFLTAPIETYFAQARRGQLSDDAARISRRIDADVRDALPTSVRQASNGTYRVLDMIAIERTLAGGIARYRTTTLTINGPDTDGQLTILGTYLPAGSPLTALPDPRRLIVGQVASSPYSGTRFMTAPMQISLQSGAPGEETLTYSGVSNFQRASLSNRIFITARVPTVAFLCDLTQQTLTRYEGFPIEGIASHDTAAELQARSTASELIAQGINACTFRPVAPRVANGPPQSIIRGLVSYQITVMQDGELMRVFEQTPLEIGP